MAKTAVGRLALRAEGEFWNAYWSPSLTTMERALLLGGIRMSLVERSADAKALFMETMQAAFSAVVEDTVGETPTWNAPQAAPEPERGGHA